MPVSTVFIGFRTLGLSPGNLPRPHTSLDSGGGLLGVIKVYTTGSHVFRPIPEGNPTGQSIPLRSQPHPTAVSLPALSNSRSLSRSPATSIPPPLRHRGVLILGVGVQPDVHTVAWVMDVEALVCQPVLKCDQVLESSSLASVSFQPFWPVI